MSNVLSMAKRQDVTLRLEPKVVRRIDDLISEVSEWPAVREFGVDVTRETVARIALLRGLQDVESQIPKPAAPAPKKAKKAAAPPPEKPAVAVVEEDAERDENGLIVPPEGWSKWSPTERVPSHHLELHQYYESIGWPRWWGRVGEETISFYGSPDDALHDAAAYDKPDMKGKSIMVQKTPWGPGHIIPHGWGQ